MREDIENFIQRLVDRTNPKVIDKISYALMLFILCSAVYLFGDFLAIIRTPLIQMHSVIFYTVICVLSDGLFFFTMLGDKLNKPINRPRIFLFSVIVFSVIIYCLLAEILNYAITNVIGNILETTQVPSFLIHTNVRIVTVFIPLIIIVLVFNKSYSVFFNKEHRKQLLEYQLDILTRSVYEMNDTTLNIKLCEDIETGKDVKLCEAISVRHTLIDGSSGSGKTALNLRPQLAQIFYKKSFYREKLKELTFKALEEGLCYINKPITNKFLNENFSMKFVTVEESKKKEFLELFKDYIVGVRKNHSRRFSETKDINRNEDTFFEVPFKIHQDITKLAIAIKIYYNGMIESEKSFDFTKNINETFENKDLKINIKSKSFTRDVKEESHDVAGNTIYETKKEFYEKDFGEGNLFSEYIDVKILNQTEEAARYKISVTLDEFRESKIIYKDIGCTVIAPDGGLSKDTIAIAQDNGIKVHKIDPKKEEIDKGDVDCINPMLVGTPEKAGDIVSSILVAMETSSGKDSNPYFMNASIRAIRNIIILLRVSYPLMNGGNNTVLTDALDCLNNPSLVVPYVEYIKRDDILSVRWKSVIDYFETNFYSKPTGEDGKPVKNSHIGSKSEKTIEAISGLVNQLDNLLGREEIKYIFCNREKSLNLSEVLEKGECIAISTRQSDLGDVLGKAFALMNILSIQNAVLGRYSEDENPEILYHIMIDEFPFYINDQTKVFFTFARKYKCPVTIAIQNLAQLEEVSKVFREVVFTNCTTKIVLPGANVEDRQYFCDYFGIEEKFEITTSVSSNPVITENPKYSESSRGAMKDTNKVTTQDLAELKFKRCYYSTVDFKGNNVVGKGYMEFLKLTPQNTIKPKYFDFEKFYYSKNEKSEEVLKEKYKKETVKSDGFTALVKPNTVLDIDNEPSEVKVQYTEKEVINNDNANHSINNKNNTEDIKAAQIKEILSTEDTLVLENILENELIEKSFKNSDNYITIDDRTDKNTEEVINNTKDKTDNINNSKDGVLLYNEGLKAETADLGKVVQNSKASSTPSEKNTNSDMELELELDDLENLVEGEKRKIEKVNALEIIGNNTKELE